MVLVVVGACVVGATVGVVGVVGVVCVVGASVGVVGVEGVLATEGVVDGVVAGTLVGVATGVVLVGADMVPGVADVAVMRVVPAFVFVFVSGGGDVEVSRADGEVSEDVGGRVGEVRVSDNC